MTPNDPMPTGDVSFGPAGGLDGFLQEMEEVATEDDQADADFDSDLDVEDVAQAVLDLVPVLIEYQRQIIILKVIAYAAFSQMDVNVRDMIHEEVMQEALDQDPYTTPEDADDRTARSQFMSEVYDILIQSQQPQNDES